MDKGVLATVAVRWVWRRVAACGHRRETEAVAKVKQSPVDKPTSHKPPRLNTGDCFTFTTASLARL